jgi:hypothetical protein
MLSEHFLRESWFACGGDSEALKRVRFVATEGGLPSVFAVSDLAAGSVAAAALALAQWRSAVDRDEPVRVDRRLAALWFGFSLRPIGWQMPPAWDPVAGDYRCADGWIRLHTNAPLHRDAALRVLGVPAERNEVARAVAGWPGEALESAVFAAGGCAAVMTSLDDWRAHPQGAVVMAEPLLTRELLAEGPLLEAPRDLARPLSGIRVLDLTRIIAGPVATRFLAGLGAEVLRIDPPGWDEPSLAPEVTLGKRCAWLDLRDASDRATFERLLGAADVLVHGYRPGALEALGLDAESLRALNPGLVEARLDAWGWKGPWASRRGFDSLVQMRSGIAHAGMEAAGAERPVPLPVQALDHAAGYLLAMAVLRGLTERRLSGRGSRVHGSLAGVAAMLTGAGRVKPEAPLAAETDADLGRDIEMTAWGAARRIAWPATVAGVNAGGGLPARELGTDPACWQG